MTNLAISNQRRVIETEITLWLPEGVIPNLAQKHHVKLLKEAWDIALHWLIKLEIRSNHKIPCSRKLANDLKTRGEYLQSLYILCKNTHPLLSDKYLNYWDLFKACLGELVLGGCGEIIYPSEPSKARDKKEAYLSSMHSAISAAKRRENPFIGTDMKSNEALLDTAIRMAEGSDIFDKKVYAPFIKKWREWAKDIDKTHYRTFEKDGHLYQQIKTKYKRKII